MNNYIIAKSKIGYDRRYEDKIFPIGTKCIELVDYIGTGVLNDKGEVIGDEPGNSYLVYYCRAESFYRAFANATFGGPCIISIGEYPSEIYDEDGEAVITSNTKRINMAAAFKGSDLEILPHGCSRYLIDNLNSTFEDCKKLRSWTPQEMVDAGLAGVKDDDAPRIIRSNGIARGAFMFNLAPLTMKRMFAGCTSYDGYGINIIDLSKLKDENAASGFASGCRFAPHYLNAFIDSLHRSFFVLNKVRTPLRNLDLGEGYVTGETAKRAKELIAAGIELTGFEID